MPYKNRDDYRRYDRRRRALERQRSTRDALLVTCWCEADVVLVPHADVRDGRTESCGAENCKPKELAHGR